VPFGVTNSAHLIAEEIEHGEMNPPADTLRFSVAA
jgi:hypothetical protein